MARNLIQTLGLKLMWEGAVWYDDGSLGGCVDLCPCYTAKLELGVLVTQAESLSIHWLPYEDIEDILANSTQPFKSGLILHHPWLRRVRDFLDAHKPLRWIWTWDRGGLKWREE
jgi:hypothetical protein